MDLALGLIYLFILIPYSLSIMLKIYLPVCQCFLKVSWLVDNLMVFVRFSVRLVCSKLSGSSLSSKRFKLWFCRCKNNWEFPRIFRIVVLCWSICVMFVLKHHTGFIQFLFIEWSSAYRHYNINSYGSVLFR